MNNNELVAIKTNNNISTTQYYGTQVIIVNY